MRDACLERAPGPSHAPCLQTPLHPGTHQAYFGNALIEWESPRAIASSTSQERAA